MIKATLRPRELPARDSSGSLLQSTTWARLYRAAGG